MSQMKCPKCGAKLSRVKRTHWDKLLDLISIEFFRLKRYQCGNCLWQGLKTRFARKAANRAAKKEET